MLKPYGVIVRAADRSSHVVRVKDGVADVFLHMTLQEATFIAAGGLNPELIEHAQKLLALAATKGIRWVESLEEAPCTHGCR